MSLYNSVTYLSDLQKSAATVDYSKLYGKTVLVTGATGLIGSAVADILLWCNRAYNAGIKVLAASRNPEKVIERFDLFMQDGLIPIQYEASQPFTLDVDVDYIIHAASNATPEAYVNKPVDTMLANIVGIHELLKYAVNREGCKVVYVSSSEVYGVQKRDTAIKEEEYGVTNILSPRSSYPIGKQASETLCVGFASQYGCDISIVRPGHIYGPTAGEWDNRVSSAFARLAADGTDIVMKSAGSQIRSYCHCFDCATAIIAVMLKGEKAKAYNVSNKNSIITIRQMAELLSKHGGVELKTELANAAELSVFNPMDNSSLNSEALESLGWEGIFDADEGLKNTVQILREIKKER